jgi:hypothetical protein
MNKLKYTFFVIAALLQFSFTNDSGFQYRNQTNQAFTFGEELKYKIHYGFINAAVATISVDPKPVDVNGRSTYHITAKGRTLSGFDWMYKVRDHFETWVDTESMAPLKYFKTVREDKYRDTDLVFYNHAEESLRGKKKDMEMPRYAQDVVSAMYYARTLDFSKAKKGDAFPINIYLDQEIYSLKFKFLGRQTIKTKFGRIKCLKIRPQVVADRVFKDEDSMTIWVSDDANRVPVRVSSSLWVGAIKCDLVGHKGLMHPFGK